MTPITLILPYYNNPGMLAVHVSAWRGYAPDLKTALHVIVVDDCSAPNKAARAVIEDTGIASLRLYRTAVDVRWNWLFCRNLGAREATTDWLLLTDVDHVMPAATLRRLTAGGLDDGKVYRFSRMTVEAAGGEAPPVLTPYKPHADSFFMTKALYWRLGGYDERFSGFYGSSSDIRHRMTAMGISIDLLPEALLRYPRETIADASMPKTIDGLPTRKTRQDEEGLSRVRAQIKAMPPGAWKPRTISFPYERLI